MTADDEFLMPPPGIAVPSHTEAKSEPTPVAEEDFISLPPGIAPPDFDSTTHRGDHSRRFRVEPAAELVFFPVAAPGMPPEPPAAVDDATRASIGRRSAAAWRLGLPDGRQLLLERTTLVGRDPARSAEWADAEMLPVVDPGKSVSKTHAAFEVTPDGQALVHDLHSTNGVCLRFAGGDEIDVIPGVPRLLEPGASVVLGEFAIALDRS